MNEKMKKNIVFVVKFFTIFFILHTLLYFAPIEGLLEWIAGFEAGLLGLVSAENIIFVGEHSFEISESCTGLVSGIILAGVVFALRKPGLKKKIELFVIGFAVLFAANLLRVYIVIAAAVLWGAHWADLLHTISWFSTAGLVLLLWYYLTKKFAGINNFFELL